MKLNKFGFIFYLIYVFLNGLIEEVEMLKVNKCMDVM